MTRQDQTPSTWMEGLIWTLPFQKITLLAGLLFVQSRPLFASDALSVLPEIFLAVAFTALLSGVDLRSRGLRAIFSAAAALAAFLLAYASWLLVGTWIVSGTPPSHGVLDQMLGNRLGLIQTFIDTPRLHWGLLSSSAIFCALWFGVEKLKSSLLRERSLPEMTLRRRLALAGAAAFGFMLMRGSPSWFQRPLILLTTYDEDQLSLPMHESVDPATFAEVGAPHDFRPHQPPAPVKQVLLIVMESVRFQRGSRLDRGFPRAIHFDRVYAHHVRSIKTLESLIFGVYPSLPVITAAWHIEDYAARMKPLPMELKKRGMDSRYVGGMALRDGFAEVFDHSGFKDITALPKDPELAWGSNAESTFARIAETLEAGKRAERGQFVLTWTTECHLPYESRKISGRDPLSMESYLACHDSLAGSLERLIARLDKSGVLAETLVVVLGDHGEIFGSEHAFEWGHGFHVFEPSLRLPVLFFLPGGKSGRHDERLFQPADIPATILGAMGMRPPRSWVGRNMLDPDEPGRKFVFFLNLLSDGTIGLLEASGIKYVRYPSVGILQRYDLTEDPLEKSPDLVKGELRASIDERMDSYLTFTNSVWEGGLLTPAEEARGRAYLARYPDVKAHPYFGKNARTARIHYLRHGKGEGRIW